MPNSKAHCSVDYHEFNGSDLDIKAHLVAEGIYTNNPPFTVPPVTQFVSRQVLRFGNLSRVKATGSRRAGEPVATNFLIGKLHFIYHRNVKFY